MGRFLTQVDRFGDEYRVMAVSSDTNSWRRERRLLEWTSDFYSMSDKNREAIRSCLGRNVLQSNSALNEIIEDTFHALWDRLEREPTPNEVQRCFRKLEKNIDIYVENMERGG